METTTVLLSKPNKHPKELYPMSLSKCCAVAILDAKKCVYFGQLGMDKELIVENGCPWLLKLEVTLVIYGQYGCCTKESHCRGRSSVILTCRTTCEPFHK